LPADFEVSTYAASIIHYAIELARASETYEVHSWMILLGVLKHEQCTAAKVLRSLGVDDLYGAWHEVGRSALSRLTALCVHWSPQPDLGDHAIMPFSFSTAQVLWALHVCDGLKPRPFIPEIGFAERAYWILTGASNFAAWNMRSKIQSEDLLLALSAGNVLNGLFPDLGLSFPHVRNAVEKQTGGHYVLPDDQEEEETDEAEDADSSSGMDVVI
jgi:hypothetical protein